MNWFWDNVVLKKEDRLSMISFVVLVVCLLGWKWYLVALYEPSKDIHWEASLEKIEFDPGYTEEIAPARKKRWAGSNPSQKTHSSRKSNAAKISDKKKSEPMGFSFDPNTVNEDSLLFLGISKYVAQNIIKYRAKGGRFHKAEDLAKIYGMDSTLFEELKPFIEINSSLISKHSSEKKKKYNARKLAKLLEGSIDINKADTTTFKKLRGIGTVYANRIVKFRNSLGGFYSVDQINQVWGISDSLYHCIKPYLSVDGKDVQRKNINDLDKNQLARHPYIDWKRAKIICKFRKVHGNFESMEDFKNVHGISVDFLDTLTQYFDVR